jgi:DNA polymerase elongation subunit (family B)
MYTKKELLNLLVFDIETTPAYPSFDAMPPALQAIWLQKHHYRAVDKEIENRKKQIAIEQGLLSTAGITVHTPTFNEIYIQESPLHAEFAKVLCIGFGGYDDNYEFIVDVINFDDEKGTINSFLDMLRKFDGFNLCGYNIMDFDIPFLLKRMWINKICSNYPSQLQLRNAKPWTVSHVDHFQNWRAGGMSYTSLNLLCEVMGIKTPKDKFQNSEISTLLSRGEITREDVADYCAKDVTAQMELVLQLATDDNNYDATQTKIKKPYQYSK